MQPSPAASRELSQTPQSPPQAGPDQESASENSPPGIQSASTTMKAKKEKKAKPRAGEDLEGSPSKREAAAALLASVTGRWNKEEHDKFIDAIKRFGKDWKRVEQHIESRTGAQIRSHAQKFFNRIIKKFNIEKNNVIDFVHNAYNSNIDSSIQSPKRKKKGEPAVPKNKNSLYVFNEEPNIALTTQNNPFPPVLAGPRVEPIRGRRRLD